VDFLEPTSVCLQSKSKQQKSWFNNFKFLKSFRPTRPLKAKEWPGNILGYAQDKECKDISVVGSQTGNAVLIGFSIVEA
jgi:hypothetical protein